MTFALLIACLWHFFCNNVNLQTQSADPETQCDTSTTEAL